MHVHACFVAVCVRVRVCVYIYVYARVANVCVLLCYKRVHAYRGSSMSDIYMRSDTLDYGITQ